MNELHLHPMVATLAAMDAEEVDRELAPSGSCARCNEFRTWIRWSLSEPSALRSFLLGLFDEHVDAAGEASFR